MLQKFKNFFNKPDNDELTDSTLQNTNIRFVLIITDDDIGDLEIGTLEINNNQWSFQYSDSFKTQDKYSRIVGFSELDKVYTSEVLWPFFKIRIPGLKQPLVQEILNDEKINKNDEASLLKRFGRINTSNPYILEPA